MTSPLLIGAVLLMAVAALPAASASHLDANLVAYYPMDESSGLFVPDHGPHSHTGTILGGSPVWTAGQLGGGLAVNGGQVPLNLPELDTAPGGKVTVAFWMFWSGETNVMPFGFHRYDLWFSSDYFGFNTGVSNIEGVDFPAHLHAAKWTHVVAEFTTGDPLAENKLWIDGVPQAIWHTQGGYYNGEISTTPYISGWGYNADYRLTSTVMDEVRIYHGALSDAQVLAVMGDDGSHSPEPPVPELPTLVLVAAAGALVAVVVARRR